MQGRVRGRVEAWVRACVRGSALRCLLRAVDVVMRAPSRAAWKFPDAEPLPAVPLTAWAPTGTG